MIKYTKDVRLLASLETFNREVFVGDTNCPQEVCDLVLAIALAFNDFKDLIYAHTLLFTVAPSDLQARTPEVGQFAGLNLHIARSLAGMLHELMRLLNKNAKVLDHAMIKRVTANLNPEARHAWKSLVAVSTTKPANTPIAAFIVRVRNQVAFHYDPSQIAD